MKLEDRKPIIDIFEQTPEIPDNCQWCIFLRNHDELTLEMVTDIERDYMFDEYARDKTMRINRGIRRRLVPMMDNDRRRIELLNGLLMSVPGTPVLFITATKSAWGTIFIWAIATGCARRCNGMAMPTQVFRTPIRNDCTRP